MRPDAAVPEIADEDVATSRLFRLAVDDGECWHGAHAFTDEELRGVRAGHDPKGNFAFDAGNVCVYAGHRRIDVVRHHQPRRRHFPHNERPRVAGPFQSDGDELHGERPSFAHRDLCGLGLHVRARSMIFEESGGGDGLIVDVE